jgi:hypothetical protein
VLILSNGRMADQIVAKRLVFHLGGYDATSPDALHRRFKRELRRFEATWETSADASALQVGSDIAIWQVSSVGPNWQVETEFRLVRWDDIVAATDRLTVWHQIPLGLFALLDFVVGGALWGYLRQNWRYAGFFIYPVALLSVLATFAVALGVLVAWAINVDLAGFAVAALTLSALLHWPGRALHLPRLLGDWIFSRAYIRHESSNLDARLERAARDLVTAARQGEPDEILIVGHSLGAVLAVDVINRALILDSALGQSGPRVAFLSVGSSILKIGLHRGAKRFRAAVERVAAAPGVFWAEYQAVSDVMNFYKTDPIDAMRLTVKYRPVVRVVRFSRMLRPAAYRRIRRNFFRVHCQFVSGNDQRATYDYFMHVCGPLSTMEQANSVDGAVQAIGSDGSWRSVSHASRVPMCATADAEL